MNWAQKIEGDRTFLNGCLAQIDHEITRDHNAQATARDSLEESSMELMLSKAEQERAIIEELRAQQADADQALALDALIMHHLQCCKRQITRLTHNWRRGSPTPDGYWEVETRHNFLMRLLAQYRAWTQDHPADDPAHTSARSAIWSTNDHPDHGSHVAQYPWYIRHMETVHGPATASGDRASRNGHAAPNPLCALEDAIYHALDRACFPEGYLQIVVESPEIVVVRGYAHTHDERNDILLAVMSVENIQKVLIDIAILAPGQEPPALYDRSVRKDALQPSDQA